MKGEERREEERRGEERRGEQLQSRLVIGCVVNDAFNGKTI